MISLPLELPINNSQKMVLSLLHHKGEDRIKVQFPIASPMIQLIREVKGRKWSKTRCCWHVPHNQEAIEEIKRLFAYSPPQPLEPVKEEKKVAVVILPVRRKPEPPLPSPSIVSVSEGQEGSKTFSPKKKEGEVLVAIDRGSLYLKIGIPYSQHDIDYIINTLEGKWCKNLKQWEVKDNEQFRIFLRAYFKERLKKNTSFTADSKGNTKKLLHNEALLTRCKGRLKIETHYNKRVVDKIKSTPGFFWQSKTKSWIGPFTTSNCDLFTSLLQQAGYKVSFQEEEIAKPASNKVQRPDAHSYTRPCPEEYKQKLIIRRYSESTIRSYMSLFLDFINYYPDKELDVISEEEIRSYMLYLIEKRQVSESYQNQAINAIKFYYEKVKGGPRKVYDIERPIKSLSLPTVLSEEEIIKILSAIKNLKHRCIIYLVYSSGLRLSEVANLTLKDILSDRGLILVRGGKGKKDRTTILSDKILSLLRVYYKEYKPGEYLFEGIKGGMYSKRSIQQILKQAIINAGFGKKATIHTLRHSFATHLLERGTDLRYIQALLGHESSKTTEIYTHITTKGIDKIKSPLDNLNL